MSKKGVVIGLVLGVACGVCVGQFVTVFVDGSGLDTAPFFWGCLGSLGLLGGGLSLWKYLQYRKKYQAWYDQQGRECVLPRPSAT